MTTATTQTTTRTRNPLADVVTGRTQDGSPRNGAYIRGFEAKTRDGQPYPSCSISFSDEETGERYVLFALEGSPAALALGHAVKDLYDLGLLGDQVKYPQFRVRKEVSPEAAAAAKADSVRDRIKETMAKASSFARQAEVAQADADRAKDEVPY